MFDLRSIKVIIFGALAMLLAFTMPSFSSATFTDSSTSTASVTSGTWDATPPTVTMNSPGGQVSGMPTVTATARDNPGGGIQHVTIQSRPAGGGVWSTLCTDEKAPYECTWNTTPLSNGNYQLQAVATDTAGLSTTSVPVGVRVANSASGALVLFHPGEPVSGNVRLNGHLSTWLDWPFEIQYRTATGWGTLCEGRGSQNLSCDWNTLSFDDGVYEVRAAAARVWGWFPVYSNTIFVTVNNSFSSAASLASERSTGTASGNSAVVDSKAETEPADDVPAEDLPQTAPTETAPVEPTPVEPAPEDELEDESDVEPAPEEPAVPGDDEDEAADEAPVEEAELRGVGIDVTDGGGGVGILNEGDSFTFTYSGEVDLTTVLPGWSGEATAVSVRLRDGQLLGGGAQDDTLDVRSGDLPVELGHVYLGADVIDVDQQILLPATMTAASSTVDGVLLSTVTVTLGTVLDEDEVLQPATTTPALTWTPSATVTTVTGRACVVAPVTQSAGGSF